MINHVFELIITISTVLRDIVSYNGIVYSDAALAGFFVRKEAQ